ncbi:MAG: OadG family protein [Desulfofustis sp.]|jgi:sodium pump decarboxylase gamma subunit|nr:OadG family protein [Desulfofustis sp.]
MDISDLLAKFSDPATIGSLSFGDKMLAGLVATVLGMGVTFLALIVLHGVIVLLGRLTDQPAVEQPAETEKEPAAGAIGADTVAAITAALALVLRTSPDSLVVREIKRVEDTAPAWGRVGLIERLRSGD